MRVLLINSNLKNDLLAAPPIGLCYVASAARAAGHEVRVVDLCFKARPHEFLTGNIKEFAPEAIGVSLRNIDNCNMLYPVSYLPEAKQLIQHIRVISNAPVILGGAGVAVMPEAVLAYLPVDYLVVADGEESFLSLLTALQTRGPPATSPGWPSDAREISPLPAALRAGAGSAAGPGAMGGPGALPPHGEQLPHPDQAGLQPPLYLLHLQPAGGGAAFSPAAASGGGG